MWEKIISILGRLAVDFAVKLYLEKRLDNESAKKLTDTFAQIDKRTEEAIAIIEKPVDQNLSQEEREKEREKRADDFFDKLR